MPDFKIIDVTEDLTDKYPPACFLNPKNEGYQIKRAVKPKDTLGKF